MHALVGDVEMAKVEILGIRELLVKLENGEISAEQAELWAKQAENGELPDEALEQVSGGSVLGTIALVALGVICVAGIAVAVDNAIQSATGRHW